VSSTLRSESPVTLTARQRARAEVTAEILRSAREQLATDGTSGISLRAVARHLGMPSSGIYRYFSTRDELVTRLIIEAYGNVGSAAERSQLDVPADDLRGRFAAACRAVRAWALANPHEYSLVFGSPIPDYEAPEETVAAAARVPAVFAAIVLDVVDGAGPPRPLPVALTDAGRRAIGPAMDVFASRLPAEYVQAAIMVWTAIFGTISFELYGHLYGSVGDSMEDRNAFFDSCVAQWSVQAGLA
jgi:AcrR family transcriptional regulator